MGDLSNPAATSAQGFNVCERFDQLQHGFGDSAPPRPQRRGSIGPGLSPMFGRIVIAGGVSQLDDNGRGGAQGDKSDDAHAEDHWMVEDDGDHGR